MRERPRSERGAIGWVLSCAAAALIAPPSGAAQARRAAMASECATADIALAPLCLEGALSLEAARGGIGLAAAQSTPVPGSASTLGRRLGTSPRIALAFRGGTKRVGMPDPRAGGAPAPKRAFWVPAGEGTLTLGVLDGFSILPTVGGLLSLDLLASAGIARLGDGDGFGSSVQWFGYGARLGLLRESFTLPGVSLSLARRHLTEVEWGLPGDQARAVFKPVVTSVRAAVGKDFLAFGILGGWGWERYSGSSTMSVERVLFGTLQTGQAASGDFVSDRALFFGGLSYTFLVLQFAAEGGFATGWDQPPGRDPTAYDPTAGTIFASVSARLTF